MFVRAFFSGGNSQTPGLTPLEPSSRSYEGEAKASKGRFKELLVEEAEEDEEVMVVGMVVGMGMTPLLTSTVVGPVIFLDHFNLTKEHPSK